MVNRKNWESPVRPVHIRHLLKKGPVHCQPPDLHSVLAAAHTHGLVRTHVCLLMNSLIIPHPLPIFDCKAVTGRDQHAVCSILGLPVGPFTLTTTPVPLRKPRARHDLKDTGPHQRRASVSGGQAAFRSGSDPLDATLRSPLHFPACPPQTEALLNVDRDLHGFEVHGIPLRTMITNAKEIAWAKRPVHVLEGGNR